MPHQCTTCGHTFEDGSKEMLAGCPDCGGNKFQFYPAGTELSAEPASDADAPPAEGSGMANAVGKATTKVRDFVSKEPDATAPWPDDDPDDQDDDAAVVESDDDIIDADAQRAAAEDTAQVSARSELASEADVAAAGGRVTDADEAEGSDESDTEDADSPGQPSNGRVVSEPTGEQPDMSELREQLNDQFESIKILEPGQYELNLMELYDREEYIIALQENGRYVIQVPEKWIGDSKRGRGDTR